MKFCPKCGSLYFLRKASDNTLLYDCRNCGYNEPRDISDNCIFQSDIDGSDHMTNQMSQNPYVIRDPTLPRLSNVKCINERCLTNDQASQLVLINSNNLKEDDFLEYLGTKGSGDLKVNEVLEDDITNYGEIHTSLGNIPILNKSILETNPIKLLRFKDSVTMKHVVDQLTDINNKNLIPDQYIKDKENNTPILSPILREIISIKYDDINMKYMYICSTCGSSWKNLT